MNAIRALIYCAVFILGAPLASAREGASNTRTLYVEVD